MRYLSRSDVLALGGGDIRAAMDDVRSTLALLRAGDAEMPAETSVPLGPPDDMRSRAYALPARLGGSYAAVGVKWTAHRPAVQDGHPSILSLTCINDAHTGLPLGIVESALLTRMRTAAVSALVLVHAAPVVLSRVAVLGAGAQARTHCRMLATLYPHLRSVRVWNRDPLRAERLDASIPSSLRRDWSVAAMPSIAAALADADAVLCCTDATAPILPDDAVRPGRIVLQVGRHEAPFGAIARADAVLVDAWGEYRLTSQKSLFHMHRAGQFGAADVAADLADIVLGGWRPQAGQAVFFSSFGLNVFDIALATRLLRHPGHAGSTLSLPGAETWLDP